MAWDDSSGKRFEIEDDLLRGESMAHGRWRHRQQRPMQPADLLADAAEGPIDGGQLSAACVTFPFGKRAIVSWIGVVAQHGQVSRGQTRGRNNAHRKSPCARGGAVGAWEKHEIRLIDEMLR